MSPNPEQEARIDIDRMLLEADWLVQDNLWRQVLEYFDGYLVGLTAGLR